MSEANTSQDGCPNHSVVESRQEDGTVQTAPPVESASPADWLKQQAIKWAWLTDENEDGSKPSKKQRAKAFWICAAFKTAAEQAQREGWTRTR